MQLPPSRLGSLLNFLCVPARRFCAIRCTHTLTLPMPSRSGSGVYHSSVQLSLPLGPSDLDPSPLEYAFGGHDEPGLSGIFSIPAGTAAARMPGLRYYTTVDCGEAFGDDWRRAFRPEQRKGELEAEAASEGAGRPYSGWAAVGSRSTVNLASGDGDDPFRDPDEDDGGASDGTEYMTRAERRAWRIIQDLKGDAEWNGQRYRLLEKCVVTSRSWSSSPSL